MLRPRLRIDLDVEGRAGGSPPRGGTAAPTASSRLVKKISSASTVTVPDSIFDRSRMSLIRFSRSVPAPWMVRANSTCLAVRLPSGLSVSCWPRIRMLLSGVRSSCDMLARNSDLYFEVSASSVAFSSSARRACSISWFLRSTSTLRSASCCAFCSSCSLVCCSSFCCVCSSPASCCDCVEQPFGLHRRLDAVEHDADAGGQLLEEGELQGGEGVERGELDHRLHLVLEQHRQHDDVARHRLEQRRADRHGVRRHLGDQHAPLVGRALADQALAERACAADGRWRRRRRRPTAAAALGASPFSTW